MNIDRIKVLWVEGTKSCWPRPGKFTAGEYDYNLEKFAELIIEECAQVNNTSAFNDGEFCARELLEHFEIRGI
jgi:hypothetical protein